MSERPSPGTTEYLSQPSKRPSIEALRELYQKGVSPYALIKNVLHDDADALFRGVHEGATISDGITELYGLKPSEGTEPSKIDKWFFLEGFCTAATIWYPLFVAFSEDPSMPLRITKIGEEMIEVLLPGIKEDSLPKPKEEFEKMLKEDPSGETWLKKRLEETFGGKGPGLDGAISAISGAAKLYQLITNPSPKKT